MPESCTLSGFTGRWHLDRIPKALDIACRLRVSSQTQNDGHGDVVCGSPHRDHRSHDLHVPFEPFFLFFFPTVTVIRKKKVGKCGDCSRDHEPTATHDRSMIP